MWWPFKKKVSKSPATWDIWMTRNFGLVIITDEERDHLVSCVPNPPIPITRAYFPTEEAALTYLFEHGDAFKFLDPYLTDEFGHWLDVQKKLQEYVRTHPPEKGA
jgi:hypothetical protein